MKKKLTLVVLIAVLFTSACDSLDIVIPVAVDTTLITLDVFLDDDDYCDEGPIVIQEVDVSAPIIIEGEIELDSYFCSNNSGPIYVFLEDRYDFGSCRNVVYSQPIYFHEAGYIPFALRGELPIDTSKYYEMSFYVDRNGDGRISKDERLADQEVLTHGAPQSVNLSINE